MKKIIDFASRNTTKKAIFITLAVTFGSFIAMIYTDQATVEDLHKYLDGFATNIIMTFLITKGGIDVAGDVARKIGKTE